MFSELEESIQNTKNSLDEISHSIWSLESTLERTRRLFFVAALVLYIAIIWCTHLVYVNKCECQCNHSSQN